MMPCIHIYIYILHMYIYIYHHIHIPYIIYIYMIYVIFPHQLWSTAPGLFSPKIDRQSPKVPGCSVVEGRSCLRGVAEFAEWLRLRGRLASDAAAGVFDRPAADLIHPVLSIPGSKTAEETGNGGKAGNGDGSVSQEVTRGFFTVKD